jgi:acyl carrier protein
MLKNCQSTVMEIIEIALELKPGVLKENSSSEKMDEWDSLGQLSILVALDKYFKGQISGISEMAEADSVQKILTILKGNSLC